MIFSMQVMKYVVLITFYITIIIVCCPILVEKIMNFSMGIYVIYPH